MCHHEKNLWANQYPWLVEKQGARGHHFFAINDKNIQTVQHDERNCTKIFTITKAFFANLIPSLCSTVLSKASAFVRSYRCKMKHCSYFRQSLFFTTVGNCFPLSIWCFAMWFSCFFLFWREIPEEEGAGILSWDIFHGTCKTLVSRCER